MRFDLKRLEVVGQAVPALDDVAINGAAGMLALAAEGTLLYESNQISRVDRSLDWMTRDGQTSVLFAKKLNWSNPRFSPDGKRLAIQINDGKQEDIWVYDLASDNRTQLIFDPGNDGYPVWTPDGKRIVFSSNRDKAKGANLYWMNADGTGEPTRLTESPNSQIPMSWHPGGKFLAFFETRPGNSYDLMILPMEGDAVSGVKPGTPTVFLSTKAGEAIPTFSPDGHWIAYMSDELRSGSYDVLVRPFPQKAGGPRRVSTGGGYLGFLVDDEPRAALCECEQGDVRALLGRGRCLHVGPASTLVADLVSVGALSHRESLRASSRWQAGAPGRGRNTGCCRSTRQGGLLHRLRRVPEEDRTGETLSLGPGTRLGAYESRRHRRGRDGRSRPHLGDLNVQGDALPGPIGT